MTIKEQIAHLMTRALDDAQSKGLLPSATIDDVAVERPQNPEHGDFACSLPMKLARPMRMNPMDIAEKLVSLIPVEGALSEVSAARPGFINFSLKNSWLGEQIEVIREAGMTFGNVDIGAGKRVQVEFVSVNPTGPLHVAHARGAVIGSALANILDAAGYDVEREYYFNDAGNQMNRFYHSLYARYQQLFGRDVELPPDGYQGEYMVEMAREVKSERGDSFLDLPESDAIREIGKIGLEKIMDAIREDVASLRVRFDVWFNEASLYTDGQYERAMELLKDNDFLTEHEGAVWFTSTALGEDKDAVLVRSNGTPTYFAADVAYHYNKFVERGFDQVIDVWGADHQGHVARTKAATVALGVPPGRLTIVIHQMVTLKRGDEIVKLSKRSGDIITLRELVSEVGADACRFFFLSRSPESQMEFDLELAKEQSSENPVYYVQYAHARIASILRLAQERGIDYSSGDISLITHEAELALIRKMLLLPEIIETMARNLEPHHLPHYSVELANAFHWFYQNCRVVSSVEGEEEISKARLKLAEASKIALARCLELMIMEAPDQM
ncbi:MAG: arginine--tRNA ligase [Chloroflexi bacterium]|nr:arginine--tRNA ligase [Chloroflexota bacterium]